MHRDIKLDNILVNRRATTSADDGSYGSSGGYCIQQQQQKNNSRGSRRRPTLKNVINEEGKEEQELSVKDFEFKLGDMGLAKPLKSSQDLTTTFAGTPLTMAPEMIAGRRYS